MGGVLGALLLTVTVLVGAKAFADDRCDRFLRAPPIELESAGEILRRGENFPQLKSGQYVFLITAKEDILFAEKYDVKSFVKTGRGVATHKSLLAIANKNSLRRPLAKIIIGGGEFQMAFSHVSWLTNRSGNFPNDANALDDMVRYLAKRGLAVDRATKVRAVDSTKEDFGHAPSDRTFDEWQLQIMAEVERHRRGPELREWYERFYSLTLESFPDLPAREAMMRMIRYRQAGASKSNMVRAANLFYYPLITAKSVDGMDYGIWAVLRSRYFSKYRTEGEWFSKAVADQIDNIILGAGQGFSPPIQEKWRKLGQDLFND